MGAKSRRIFIEFTHGACVHHTDGLEAFLRLVTGDCLPDAIP